ncbi:MAG: PAS domain S-box protein, partial [Deltaproteobacteria bacterium]|nr:PAS domain S-box protein [Deltaproteobacteria bacterium]
MADYISNEQQLSIPTEEAIKILNSLQEHVVYYDRDMKILWANSAALDSVEISLEKIKEKRCWSVWDQRETPCDDCPVILSMETDSLQCIEKTTSDGRSWLVKGYPVKDKHGNVIGGIETTLDITDRKKAEEKLKIAFDILSRSPAVGFMWENAEGWPVLFVTPNVSKLFGYTSDEFISGKISYEKVVYPEDLSRVMEKVRKFSSDKERKEFKHKPYRILSKNGEVKWVLDRTTIDRNNDGDILYYKGIIENITDRIKTDQVIKESEEKYRNLFHYSNDGIFIHDLQGNIIDINQKGLDLLGYTEKEMLSLKVEDFYPPEASEKAKWAFETIIDKGFVNFEIKFKRKNGDIFIVDVSSSLFNLNELKVVQGIVRDITLKKRAEKEKKKLEFQFQQAQKMEAIGTLAGGVAHDFNNLLMGIQGRTSLMIMDKDSSHPDFEHLQGIEGYVKSAADLTKQLLGFARGGKYEVKPTDINELIKKSSRMFGRTKKEIKIHGKYQKNVWTVEADQGQIEQVLMNLYINAWQAMPGGGELYLQTENVILDEDYVKPFKIEPGRYVKISVTDTGVGMNEATRQKIFDPFFTTKEMGQGSGLGLASVYGITKN